MKARIIFKVAVLLGLGGLARGAGVNGWARSPETVDATRSASSAPSFRSMAQPKTMGTKSVLFIRCAFPDEPDEPISEADAMRLLSHVSQFYRDNSYGQTLLETTVTPLLTLPQPSHAYADASAYSPLLEDARRAATAAGYPVAASDFQCVFTRPLFGETDGRGSIGGTGVLIQAKDAGLLCHELGHSFGLWHANAWLTKDGSVISAGVNVEYGDTFSTMGRGRDGLWQFNAWEKYALGWLPPAQVREVSSNGVYHLAPSDNALLLDNTTFALRLKKDLVRDYWIETRRQFLKDPELRHGLLLTWSPWGASQYGTQLLDCHPETAGFFDAPLRTNETFADPELGVTICSAPSGQAPEGAVDVLIQELVQWTVEGEAASGMTLGAAQLGRNASGGRCLATIAREGAEAVYRLEVPAEGHYGVWCRVAGPTGDGGTLAVALEGQRVAATDLEPAAGSEAWRWIRLGAEAKLQPAVLETVPLALSAGAHELKLFWSGGVFRLDCLMFTTDPGGSPAPVVSAIRDQRVQVGETVGPIPFSILDVQDAARALGIEAVSSDTNLVEQAGIRVAGEGIARTLTVTPVPHRTGSTTVTLTVRDSAGNVARTRFEVSVIGPIQAKVDAAQPGATISLPAGTCFEHVFIDKAVTIEGVPAGARTILDGAGTGVPLTVGPSGQVMLRRLTLRQDWVAA